MPDLKFTILSEPTADTPQRRKAKRNRDLYRVIKTGTRATWESKQQKCFEFSVGEQLSKEDRDDLEGAGMPTFIVNKVTPEVELLKYFVTANNPRPVAVAREGSDASKSAVVSGMFEYDWDKSSGKLEFAQVVRNSLTKSFGAWAVFIDKYADNGLGGVRFKSIDPFSLYIDPTSTDVLCRDAAYIIVKKNIRRGTLMMELPDFKKAILEADTTDEHGLTESNTSAEMGAIQPFDITTIEGDFEGMERMNDYVDYYEGYYKESAKFWNLTIRMVPTKEQMVEINKSVEQQVAVYAEEVQTSLADNMITLQDQLKSGQISEMRFQFTAQQLQKEAQKAIEQYKQQLLSKTMEDSSKTTVHIVTDADYKVMKDNETVFKHVISAVPFYKNTVRVVRSVGTATFLDEFVLDVPYIPIVAVPFIHTGTPFPMSCVQLVIGRQEEVTKAHQIMVHNASLGSNLRWKHVKGSIDEELWQNNVSTPGGLLPYNQGFEPPTEVTPQPLNSAFYRIVEMGAKEIEEVMGAMAVSQGNIDPTTSTYRGLMATDEFATRRVRSWVLEVVEPALEHLATIWFEFAKQFYTSHRVFAVVNPDNSRVAQYEINVPVYSELGDVIDRWNDVGTFDYDIKFVHGSTLPSNRQARSAEVFEYYKAGLVDDIATLAEVDIPDKEAIIQRKSTYAQLNNQVAMLEEELKKAKGENETLTRQIVQAGIRGEVKDTQLEMSKVMDGFNTEFEKYRIKLEERLKSITEGVRGEAKYSKRRMSDAVKQAQQEQEPKSEEAPKKK